ncbi:MAG: class I SAM-dependent methyltransferase [Steroidobacteraceae bacterium]|jgi:predicted SAM-dependent methyltransferase
MISRLKSMVKEKIPFALPVAALIMQQFSKRKIRRLLRQKRDIFVELGAGHKSGTGNWVTIDVTRGCDIYWDLRKGIPFPNGSIRKIYSSHFFEHLSFNEGQQFLDECKRALEPSGRFSICVPNARIYIDAYAKGDSLDEATFFGYGAAYNHTTRIDYVNYMAYMAGEHKYMFDEENLVFILRSKGFRNVHLREFDPSLDLPERNFESIYAEAEK